MIAGVAKTPESNFCAKKLPLRYRRLMLIDTSRGKKGVTNPRLRVGRTPKGGFKAYLIVDNTENNRLMWAEAGPGGTRNAEIREKWTRRSVEAQPSRGHSMRGGAEEYRALLQGLGSLEDIVALHTGLQENGFPELIDDD